MSINAPTTVINRGSGGSKTPATATSSFFTRSLSNRSSARSGSNSARGADEGGATSVRLYGAPDWMKARVLSGSTSPRHRRMTSPQLYQRSIDCPCEDTMMTPTTPRSRSFRTSRGIRSAGDGGNGGGGGGQERRFESYSETTSKRFYESDNGGDVGADVNLQSPSTSGVRPVEVCRSVADNALNDFDDNRRESNYQQSSSEGTKIKIWPVARPTSSSPNYRQRVPISATTRGGSFNMGNAVSDVEVGTTPVTVSGSRQIANSSISASKTTSTAQHSSSSSSNRNRYRNDLEPTTPRSTRPVLVKQPVKFRTGTDPLSPSTSKSYSSSSTTRNRRSNELLESSISKPEIAITPRVIKSTSGLGVDDYERRYYREDQREAEDADVSYKRQYSSNRSSSLHRSHTPREHRTGVESPSMGRYVGSSLPPRDKPTNQQVIGTSGSINNRLSIDRTASENITRERRLGDRDHGFWDQKEFLGENYQPDGDIEEYVTRKLVRRSDIPIQSHEPELSMTSPCCCRHYQHADRHSYNLCNSAHSTSTTSARPQRTISQLAVDRPMTAQCDNRWTSETNLRTTTTTNYKQPPIRSTYSAHHENMLRKEEMQRRAAMQSQHSGRDYRDGQGGGAGGGGAEVMEYMESYTLQPIGQGVQNIEPSGTRLVRAATPGFLRIWCFLSPSDSPRIASTITLTEVDAAALANSLSVRRDVDTLSPRLASTYTGPSSARPDFYDGSSDRPDEIDGPFGTSLITTEVPSSPIPTFVRTNDTGANNLTGSNSTGSGLYDRFGDSFGQNNRTPASAPTLLITTTAQRESSSLFRTDNEVSPDVSNLTKPCLSGPTSHGASVTGLGQQTDEARNDDAPASPVMLITISTGYEAPSIPSSAGSRTDSESSPGESKLIKTNLVRSDKSVGSGKHNHAPTSSPTLLITTSAQFELHSSAKTNKSTSIGASNLIGPSSRRSASHSTSVTGLGLQTGSARNGGCSATLLINRTARQQVPSFFALDSLSAGTDDNTALKSTLSASSTIQDIGVSSLDRQLDAGDFGRHSTDPLSVLLPSSTAHLKAFFPSLDQGGSTSTTEVYKRPVSAIVMMTNDGTLEFGRGGVSRVEKRHQTPTIFPMILPAPHRELATASSTIDLKDPPIGQDEDVDEFNMDARITGTHEQMTQQYVTSTQSGRQSPYISQMPGGHGFELREEHHMSTMDGTSVTLGGQTLGHVSDTSKQWYMPELTRSEAITLLRNEQPGSFLIRRSRSTPDSYSLSLKIPQDSPFVQPRPDDAANHYVRHYIIACNGSDGVVRLRDLDGDPTFNNLTAFVHYHLTTNGQLPCLLKLPGSQSGLTAGGGGGTFSASSTTKSPITLTGNAIVVREKIDSGGKFDQLRFIPSSSPRLVADLFYLGSSECSQANYTLAIASAIGKQLYLAESKNHKPAKQCQVRFKASKNDGIEFYDSKKQTLIHSFKLGDILYCSMDPDNRRIFGLLVRKRRLFSHENVVYVFCELDLNHPASRVVETIKRLTKSK